MPLTYIHVFPFSIRKITKANNFKNRVCVEKVKQRSKVMRTLSEQKKELFYNEFIGKKLDVLIEGNIKKEKTLQKGFSNNYIQILIESNKNYTNHIIRVNINAVFYQSLNNNKKTLYAKGEIC